MTSSPEDNNQSGVLMPKVEIKEYSHDYNGDRVMVWVNDRDKSKGGYCLECVPRHVLRVVQI